MEVSLLPPFFDGLSDDLVINILIRLPIKRLNRCKCVSKQWSYLISTQYFIRCYVEHRKATVTRPFCLFYQQSMFGTKPRAVSVAYTKNKHEKLFMTPGFSLEFLSKPVRVLSTNNGLVLCSINKMYHVCNPLTKSWVTIPPPPSVGRWARIGFICKPLDFDPGCCSFVIVRVANNGRDVGSCVSYNKYGENQDSSIPTAEIYSSETGKWVKYYLNDARKGFKQLMFRPCMYICPFTRLSNAVICNGLLHWVGSADVLVYDPDNKNNNNFRIVQFPGNSAYHGSRLHLGECKGNLICISFKHPTFEAWKLKDYDNNGEWELLHKVCLDQMVFYRPSLKDLFAPRSSMDFLAFHPFNEDILFLFVPHQVLSFNMHEKTIKYVCRVPHGHGKLSVEFDDWISYLVVLPLWPLRLAS